MFQKIIKFLLLSLTTIFTISICLLSIGYKPLEFNRLRNLGYFTDYALINKCTPSNWHQPSNISELSSIILDITKSGEKLKVVGAGHSTNGITMTNGHIINLDLLNKVISIDKEKKQVTVEAGIRLKKLSDI